jgi:hypothetical protein
MPRNTSSLLDDHQVETLVPVSPALYVLEKLMRSVAVRDAKSYYEKQRGSEKTLFKAMALGDGAGGDIGFIYFSNLGTNRTPVSDLPVLQEKIRLTELKSLDLMNVPRTEELDITVPQGTEKIILLKKTGADQSSYKAQFFPRLTYSNLCTPDEIRKLGKRSQLESSETPLIEQYTYFLQHDNGFAFLFENLDSQSVLMIKMVLTVENLVDAQGGEAGEWRVTLRPGEVAVRELWIEDVTKRTSLKYSFNFKNYALTPVTDHQQIVQACLAKGTKHTVEYEGRPHLICYYHCLIDARQYWLFVNDEEALTYDGTFRLKLRNLADDSGLHEEAETTWTVCLPPRQHLLKSLAVIDPFERVHVSFTSTFVLK